MARPASAIRRPDSIKISGDRPILVIRGGAIGDFVLTLPVLRALRRRFPASRLAVLGRPHIAPLAAAGGLAEEVRSLDARALAAFFVRDVPLDPAWVGFFGDFALIVSYLHDPDGIFHGNLRQCSGAELILGPHRPDESRPQHATEVFLQPLGRLGIFGADPIPHLTLHRSPGDGPAPRDRCEAPPTLAAHPGSGSPRKNWPEHQWAALLDRLIRCTDVRLLLIGGEAEGGRLERLARGLPASRLQLAQDLPLVELAERLAACTAFIGHDSGISHLAAALGLPGVVLWGDSVEAVWRPLGPRVMLLRDPDGLGGLSAERVFEGLHAVWEKGTLEH